MAKTKKTKVSKERRDISGIIYITIGILILLSLLSIFFESSSPGLVGKFIRNVLFSLFGIGAYILPFILFFIGTCCIVRNGKVQYNKNFYAIIGLIINSLALLAMITYNKFLGENLLYTIYNFFNAKSILHGGFISYLIISPIKLLIGTIGVYIVCICVYLICCIIIFDISIGDIIINLKEKIFSKERIKKTKKEKVKIIDDTEGYQGEKANKIKEENRIKLMSFLKENNNDLEADDINKHELQKEVSLDLQENDTQNKEPNILMSSVNEGNNEEKHRLKKKGNDDFNVDEEILKANMEKEIEVQYKIPPVDFLKENDMLKSKKGDKRELLNSATKLQETLSSFGVNASVTQVIQGPSVTRFEIQPESGVKVSKIVNLSDDIALNLAASGIRMEAPIPGKAAIGIEVPNENLIPVFIREIIESDEFINCKKNIAVSLGKDIGGHAVVADLSKMPHLLVAGATGSGKSVCINTLIVSLLYKYSPKEVNLLLIDPKVVELSIYNGIPHLLIPVVTEPKKAAGALHWAVTEMTKRYNLFAENGVRNIEGYNQLMDSNGGEKLPYIVIIIDELADLMMVCPKDVEDYIARLAQMARAAGMHLVIATQRPSVDVITGMIKANIPSRISFAVSSQIDSRTILDSSGAEKLLGKGDMLFYPVGEAKPLRIQGAFISEEEVENIVQYIKNQSEEVQYDEDIIEQIHNNSEEQEVVGEDDNSLDPLLKEAINFVVESKYASTSMLQRKFKIGYNRAARIIDSMEERGIISGRNGSKPRDVLISSTESNNLN